MSKLHIAAVLILAVTGFTAKAYEYKTSPKLHETAIKQSHGHKHKHHKHKHHNYGYGKQHHHRHHDTVIIRIP